jgi:hypothetical protein
MTLVSPLAIVTASGDTVLTLNLPTSSLAEVFWELATTVTAMPTATAAAAIMMMSLTGTVLDCKPEIHRTQSLICVMQYGTGNNDTSRSGAIRGKKVKIVTGS